MTHFLAQRGLMSATMQSESVLRRLRESFTRALGDDSAQGSIIMTALHGGEHFEKIGQNRAKDR